MELTIREAAALMGVSQRTLRARAARGDIPARKRGGVWKIQRRDLPLTEGQRAGLQARAEQVRQAVEDALPSRLASHAGDRRRSLADLDAFRLCLRVRQDIAQAEPTDGRQRAQAELTAALEAIAEASLLYARGAKLDALDQARRAMGHAIAQLLIEGGIPPKEPEHTWLCNLEQNAVPAVAGLARWAARLQGPRSGR